MANSEKTDNDNIKYCSVCQKPEVSIIVTTIDKDGKVVELALCQDCADHKGLGTIKKTFITPQNILAELQDKIATEDHVLICKDCGLTYANFRKHGRIGCEHCYQAFGAKLAAVIRRIHGTTIHTGKTVTDSKKKITEHFLIKSLRAMMKNAITNEDYEHAAAIRDKIQKIKQPSRKIY